MTLKHEGARIVQKGEDQLTRITNDNLENLSGLTFQEAQTARATLTVQMSKIRLTRLAIS